MIEAQDLQKLSTASRRSAIMSFIGLVIVIGSLVYSATQLRTLEHRRDQLTAEIEKLEARKEQAVAGAALAVRTLQEVTKPISGTLAEVVHPQVRATPVPGAKAANGLPLYDFVLSVSVPEGRKSEIREVQYTFAHSSFLNKQQTSTDSSNGFAVSYRGWGCLSLVVIKLMLQNGSAVPLYFDECQALSSAIPTR